MVMAGAVTADTVSRIMAVRTGMGAGIRIRDTEGIVTAATVATGAKADMGIMAITEDMAAMADVMAATVIAADLCPSI
jgi:hypothetical protein